MIKNNLTKYIVILTIIIIVGICVIFTSFTPASVISNYLYSYKLNKNVTYEVTIDKNNFYPSQTLEQDKLYISNLVEDINVNFNADYNINIPADIYYNYKIVNTIYVKYANTTNSKDNTLWSKEYVLKKTDVQNALNTTTFTIDDNISLDFEEYRKQAQSFKSTYNVPVESYMELKLILNYDTNIENINEKKQKESIISLKIPLLQEVFSIEENYQKIDSETSIENINIEAKNNKATIIIGSAIISLALVGILYIIRKEMKLNVKNNYTVALNRILKSYDDIVAEVVSPVDTDYMKIIDVKDFEQLLDIEEEIRMPILFYETIPEEEGEFVILYDNIVYRYIISGKQ